MLGISRSGPWVGSSAVGVYVQLVSDRLLAHAIPDLILEAICQGDQQVVHALFLDDLRQELACFAAVVLAQELPHLLHGDLALEVEVQVLEQKTNKLLHEEPPSAAGKSSFASGIRNTSPRNCHASSLRDALGFCTPFARKSPAIPQIGVIWRVANQARTRILAQRGSTARAKPNRVRIGALASAGREA